MDLWTPEWEVAHKWLHDALWFGSHRVETVGRLSVSLMEVWRTLKENFKNGKFHFNNNFKNWSLYLLILDQLMIRNTTSAEFLLYSFLGHWVF